MLAYFKNIHLSEALRRFPVASISSVVATLLCFYLITEPKLESAQITIVFKILIVVYFFFLSSISVKLCSVASSWSITRESLTHLGLAILGIIGYLIMPHDFDFKNTAMFRLPYYLVGIALILHLLVSYIPYLLQGNNGDFWEYNRRLFTRIIEALLFSLVLFGTLSIAILAVDKLFGINVNGDTYQYLFAGLIGIFQSWYFLSNFPIVDYDGHIDEPSKSVLVFGQFIMIPVTMIYLVILYAYAVKIAINWELPQGWVGQLSLWFSVVGVFTFLFNYFNHRFSQQTFVKWYKKYFFIVLIVPVILLFVSISRRLLDYGFTELRYILLLLSIWLAIMVLLFGILRIRHLKWIPISLSVATFLALFGGPLNMFSVTTSSQSVRLYDSMSKVLQSQEGKFSPQLSDTELLDPSLMNQLRFIDDRTDMNEVNNWLTDPSKLIDENTIKENFEESNAQRIANQIGLQITDRFLGSKGTSYFNYFTDEFSEVDIMGYDILYRFDIYNETGPNSASGMLLNSQKNQFEVYIDEMIFPVDLEPLVLYDEPSDQRRSAEELTLSFDQDGYRFKILFQNLQGERSLSQSTILKGGSGILLIDRPSL